MDDLEDIRCAATVQHVGGMNLDDLQEAASVGDDSAPFNCALESLADHDLLAEMIAAYSTGFRGLDPLAIDDTGTW